MTTPLPKGLRDARVVSVELICDHPDCKTAPIVFDAKTIDITTSGHTDVVCAACGGPMVVHSTSVQPSDDEILHAEAQQRFLEAMEHVQRAQNELDRACSLLFHVANGGSTAERRIWKVREKVHALWYWLERWKDGRTFQRIKLDGMVGPRFLEDLRKRGAP